jgi:hypothetical protein
MRSLITAAVMLASATQAAAGTVSEADISGKVQQFTRDGAISACGLVLVAHESGPPTSGAIQMFNGSYMIADISGGMVKGRAATVSVSNLAKGPVGPDLIKPVETSFVWLKAPGSTATSVMSGKAVMKSEDPGYITYIADFRSLIDFTVAVLDRKPVQIGFTTKGAKYDVILAGVVQMSDPQLQQLQQCIAEWGDGMKKRYKELAE